MRNFNISKAGIRLALKILTILIVSTYLTCRNTSRSGPLAGQIMVDPNNSCWLVYNRDIDNNGLLDPFFLCGPGDPEGFLYRGKRNPDGTRMGDQEELINKLIKNGGNCIYLMAVRTHGGDARNSARDFPDIYPDDNHNPWVDQNPAKDLNSAILDQWENWFTRMDNNNIIVYFFFYDDAIKIAKALGWALDSNGNLHPGEKQFVQSLVNRFEHHKNLIWCVMEEGQELGENWQLHVSKIAQAIREADDYDHVIASHQLAGNIFYHANDINIEQFAIQTDQRKVTTTDELHQWLIKAWENANGRYSLNMSEDFVHGNVSVPNKNRAEIRQRNWAAAMAGAYSMILGMNIDNTPDSWLQDCRILQTFFESTTFNFMYPDDSLAFGETQYVLSNAPFDYILYSANTIKNLGLKDMEKGTYSFLWMDCVSAANQSFENIPVPDGQQSWKIPEGLGKEVVCYVHRTDKIMTMTDKTTQINKGEERQVKINLTPVIENQRIVLRGETTKYIQLFYDDPDGGPGPYTIFIVSQPEHGQLSGEGNDRFYTPNSGFTGRDAFTWKVFDGLGNSIIAEVEINVTGK